MGNTQTATDWAGLDQAGEMAASVGAQGYGSLLHVLRRAFVQAAFGKGQERHANALPFDQQPMQTIASQVGVGFLLGQAIKKTQESQTLPPGKDVAELLGAINYLAGAIIALERKHQANGNGRVPANDNAPGHLLAKAGLVGDGTLPGQAPMRPVSPHGPNGPAFGQTCCQESGGHCTGCQRDG